MAVADTGASDVETTDDTAEDEERRGGFGSLGSIIQLLFLSWGVFLGTLPLNDNSFFTHLATGRIILDQGSVPSTDPYTFTAQGEPWTVQSWLASVAYALAERVGGAFGLRLLIVAVFVVATTLLWQLTRPAKSVFVRLGLMAGAMTVCSSAWSERPYMVGFIGLAVVWLALHGQVSHWVLVPLLWVWVNSHGSFPLAVALCLAVGVGTMIDARTGRPHGVVDRELLVLRSIILGIGLGAISPLGLRGIAFPFLAITQSETFQQIVEWRSPDFTSVSDRAFLVLFFVAVVSVVRSARWRHLLPLLLFAAAALVARRNIVMAVPVVVAVIAATAPTLGSLRSPTRPVFGQILASGCGALVVLIAFVGLSGPALDLDRYPTGALAFLNQVEVEGRVATQDFTGNMLEALDGPSGVAFIDDRADMIPPEVLKDFQELNRGRPGWTSVLDRYEIDVVVWERSDPLGSLLAAASSWRVLFSDASWVVACRRDGPACAMTD